MAAIGCGYWGKNFVRNFAELGALAAICDPDRKAARLRESRIQTVVLTVQYTRGPPITSIGWMLSAQLYPLPHALNERAFRYDKPDTSRPTDIGGRSARYPVFLGDDERNRIYDVFAGLGAQAGLRIDIDTVS